MARALLLTRPSPLSYPGGNPGFDAAHLAAPQTVFSGVASAGGFFCFKGPIGKGTLNSTVAQQVKGILGPTLNLSTTTSCVDFTAPNVSSPKGITIAAIFSFSTLNGAGQNIFAWTDGSFNGLTFFLENTNNQLGCFSGGSSVLGSFTIAANTPYFAVASNSAGGLKILLKNLQTGKVQTASLGAVTIANTTSGQFIVGAQEGNAAGIVGNMAAAMCAQSYLSMAQIQQWALDPWSFWYPRTLDLGMMLAAPSGATAYSLAGAEGTFSISGQNAAFIAARKTAGAEGAFAISGQSAALSHGIKLAGAEGAFAISGQLSAELRGIKSAGAEGTFAISGQAATMTPSASGHFTLAADEGAFTISGQAATLAAARHLAGAEGAFSISGQASLMLRAVKLAGVEGVFAINGQAAAELRGIKLAGVEGAFTISGQAATVGHGLHLAGAEGAFAISGQSAQFPVALSMKGTEGVFAINGGPAVLAYSPAGGGGTVAHSNPFLATPGPGLSLP